MKSLSEVLQQKESEIRRVRKEIEALHFVIPLLADDADWLEHGIAVLPILSDREGQSTAKKPA